MKTATAILAALLALAGTPVTAENATINGLFPKDVREYYVPSGKLRRLAFLHGANPVDCTPWEVSKIEVRTTLEPKNGTLQIVPEEGIAAFKSDGPLAKCSGKKVRGVAVNYKSADKFIGTDEFELLVIWPISRASEIQITVNVK